MESVTFPKDEVVNFVMKNFVPLRLAHDTQPHATDFNVKWTPTIVILDSRGKEHHRIVGFMRGDEFIPFLILGMGKIHYDNGEYEVAINYFNQVLQDYPNSGSAPEAVFLRGVSSFKKTNETEPLKETYKLLTEKYPDSDWTKRAFPYSLL